jgi:hypothetical protein
MWTFWWIVPLIGLLLCIGIAVAVIRAMRGGAWSGCMGSHEAHAGDQTAELRREVGELRKEVDALKARR